MTWLLVGSGGALGSNSSGVYNTASGANALRNNSTGRFNTADGGQALNSNATGNNNTASGLNALYHNTDGDANTGMGFQTLFNNTTGSGNIALGANAGANFTTGGNNIAIGSAGVADQANTIRIGRQGLQTATFIAGIRGATVPGGITVFVDPNGQLGTATSSERFKEQIEPMGEESETILSLRPVSFRYKEEIDPESIPQFGLVAEDVEKINPKLVARDAEGKVYTVRYEAVNAMLLNEFLKEHRKVQELEATVTRLQSAAARHEQLAAQQQKEMRLFAARLNEQASLLQKVSATAQTENRAAALVSKR